MSAGTVGSEGDAGSTDVGSNSGSNLSKVVCSVLDGAYAGGDSKAALSASAPTSPTVMNRSKIEEKREQHNNLATLEGRRASGCQL